MKFLVAFVALVAVALSTPVTRNKPGVSQSAELDAIIAAIQSPHTDPATAALLEQQLQDLIAGPKPEPIAVGPELVPHPVVVGPAIIEPTQPIIVGPAIVEEEFQPIAVGPALVDFEHVETSPVVVGPAVVGPAVVPESSSVPLVQIILNINQVGAETPSPVEVGPAVIAPVVPEPVHVVEEALVLPSPVVVDHLPTPVTVVDQVVAPVAVIDEAAESVNVVHPIIVAPVVAPETLN